MSYLNIFRSGVFPLMSAWSGVGIAQSFSVFRPFSSLARGNRFFMEVFWFWFLPMPVHGFSLEASAVPCPGYVGGNKETQEFIIMFFLKS